MADEGPGRFSRAPWERDSREERISSSPFFREQPVVPQPIRPDQPSGPQARPDQPSAARPRGDQASGRQQVWPDPPSEPPARRQRPAVEPPAVPPPATPRPSGTRSTSGRRAAGEPPQPRRRGWLVDDEVPIDPNEYFRELDGRGGRSPATPGRWTTSLFKVVAGVLAATVVLVTGIAWGTKKWAGDSFREVSALDLRSSAIVDAAKQADAENFLLIGSDIRRAAEAADENADSVGDAEAGRSARSDTMLLAHIPADRSRMVLVSFPRDVQIDRPPCETWDAATGRYTGQRDPGETGVKINTAYQIGGPKCAVQVVQKLSGVSVNHFLSIDFAGFTAMADAVGGVQLCVDKPVKDSFLGEVVARPGPVELAGAAALNFVRARHVEGDPTSDYGRIRRQQHFLAALAREALTERVLADPTRLNKLVDALAANTFADNVTVDDLLELSRSVRDLEAGKVTFVTVPTTGTANDRGNEELRTEDASALFRALIDGAQPGGAPAEPEQTSAPPAATVAPSEVKLQVLNGTGQGGLAGNVARKLGDVGFDVVKVDNAKEPAPQTVIRYSTASEAQARTLAAAVPGAQLTPDPSMGGALELVLGNGFDGEVRPVQAGQPAPGDDPAAAPPAGVQQLSAADTSCA